MSTPLSSLPPNLIQYVPSSYVDSNGNLTVSQAQAEMVASKVQEHVQQLPPAEQALYISMLDSPDFAPTGASTPDQIDATLGRLDNAMALFGQIASGAEGGLLALAEDVNALAEIIIKQAEQARQQELDNRLSARQEAKNALESQATKQDDAANKLKNHAITSLVLSCVSAAISVVSAGVSIGGAAKALKGVKGLGKAPDKLGEDATPIEQMNFKQKMDVRSEKLTEIQHDAGKLTHGSTVGSSVGQAVQGGANYENTIGQSESQLDQAQGSRFAAQAQEIEAIADTKKEAQNALEDLVKNLIQLLKEIGNSKAEEMQSMTRV